ncbi:MAG TPA: hypothetical protein VFZ29_07960 [Solirubrobacterales bacterium]
MLLSIFGFAAPAAIAAEGERLLEPRLSLTGGCGTTAVDPIPDPGPCPLESEGGPGVPGVDHPPATFSDTRAVATDLYGNIYVSSFGSSSDGSKGRVDIFCSNGTFISELPIAGASSLAIDSEGYLYVFSVSQEKLLRYTPNSPYQPETCEIEYGESAPVTVVGAASAYAGLAVDRDDDHLFANFGSNPGVVEYKSAAEGSATEGNKKVRSGPGPNWGGGNALAIDSEHNRLYVSASFAEERIDVYDLNTLVGTPPNDWYEKVDTIEDSSVPAGEFGTQLALAVDEGTGSLILLDGENCTLYEFEEDGTYVQTIPAAFLECGNTAKGIAVDNGPTSPNGKVSEEDGEGRYLYVPSNRTGIGHSYAFFLSTVGPPEIASIAAANITEDEAELRAQIDPNNAETTYSFEYKVEGGASWIPAGGGTIPTGNDPVAVSAVATGLTPGTKYVFRVVATNEKAEGEEAVEADGGFSTYPRVPTEPSPCANALLRTGASALLPDCRAYELVTPADTNGRAPVGVGRLGGVFPTRQVSPAGDKVAFRVEGGSLPGPGGTGSLNGDPYLVTRTAAGWSTTYTGPSAAEASQIIPGARSPDQGYFFYIAGDKGSAVLVPKGNTAYVHYPDGHSELIGQGSLGVDFLAAGQLISEGGDHIIFSTGVLGGSVPVQLEPEAAPSGTRVIYDRTPDGITHVVSLKPGEAPFGAGEMANYEGASLDGVGIAFKVGPTLYLRYDNEETFAIGTGVDVAGVAEGGKRVFYVQAGNLKAFDVDAGVIDFAITGDAVPVTISADGTTAYFVSETVIAESGPNPEGAEPLAGGQNLYRSVEGQIDFVGTVTERDVDGAYSGIEFTDGLGLWADSFATSRLGRVPARTTPDGSALLFKSRAALGDYDPEGHAEIYRYAAGELQCISCNPTGTPAGSEADLQTEFREGFPFLGPTVWPENLRADGRRAFFESSEALVVGDSDGLRDVYEWEDQGVGSCARPEGCVHLISSPNSQREEYIWAVSPSGDDVFFLSSDLLVKSDADETPSIYDARVGGGFAEGDQQSECEGEGCRPNLSPTPSLPTGLTPVLGSGDQANPTKAKRCPKGKHKVKRKGKIRCVKKKTAKKNRAGASRKGGSR